MITQHLKRRVARPALAILTVALGGFLVLHTENTQQQRVGPLPDGGFLLNSGWTIRPAGQQVPVDTFPMSTALSSDGKFLLVLNGGYNPPSISVIDTAQKKEIGRTPVPDAWLGLSFAPGSNRVFVGGGSKGTVYELMLDAATGALTRTHEFAVAPETVKPGKSFIGDVVTSPDAHLLYAADLSGDGIAVINLQSGRPIARWKCGRRPYRLLVTPNGKELIVSSWADAAIYQYDANTGQELSKTRVGAHPTDMLWVNKPAPSEGGETSSYVARLFVASANTNNVYSLGVSQDGQLNILESINVSMSPMHPLGMTPSALATNKEGTQLLVVCSDANAIAIADISGARSSVRGFLPTGWYPTAVRVLDDGQLVIANGKGLGSRANPDGPNPTRRNQPLYEGGPVVAPGYIAHVQTGTIAFVPAINDEQIGDYSKTVLANSPYRDEMMSSLIVDPQEAYFARTAEHASPIQHVIYIIKENRTYDQVFGDMEKGNGDKSLTLFGEQVTPNQHQLARDYILYDNFYENADVSAEGHNWAAAAIAPDYTVKTWPSSYANRKKGYDFEGGEPANTPPAGYVWDNAIQAGITIRDYGDWVTNLPLNQTAASQRQIDKIHDPALVSRVDMNYRGFDLQYSDVDRTHEFLREWKEFESKGDAPSLLIVRLGNNHTQGTKPGALTPSAYVAENDYALGQVVDAVSHSKLWASTAIFVIEDDAQNGADHVDSHRAPALVISPYTHRGIVDSTMYNQMSVLRSIELIVGLRPMTHFDAAARPMFATFSRQADTKPFTTIPAKVSLTERNPANGPGSEDSARLDFSDADRADDDELNAVLWRAIKHSDPPPPVRSAFAR
jgi:DNA-binding beta-propeller fold protein YncE